MITLEIIPNNFTQNKTLQNYIQNGVMCNGKLSSGEANCALFIEKQQKLLGRYKK